MPVSEPILDKLIQFRQRDSFSNDAWRARGLNPSPHPIPADLAEFFHACADSLISAVKAGQKPRQIKAILTGALKSVRQSNFDTEEREFICDVFMELATIVDVDIRDQLNLWLYGPILVFIMRIMRFFRPQRVVDTIRQPCTRCSTSLDLQIIRKQSGIPESPWYVVRCQSCGEYNLLSTGPNVKETRFVNFQLVESLSKEEFTHEQALMRLEQIKYFRK